MMYNLLQIKHDKITELFIQGKIEYDLFEVLESVFINRSKIFTICLN